LNKREAPVVIAVASLLSLTSLFIVLHRGWLLLFGDAVAHLHIARRVFDTRSPGIVQLGSVWLPLPHILLVPLVASNHLWRTGLAGSCVSMVCYVLAVLGLYRLARNWMRPSWAAIAAAIFALNPGLLYMQTTAMTEPLFLALFIWSIVWLVEGSRALNAAQWTTSARSFILAGIALSGAILTRYDGWILAAAAGLILLFTRALKLWRAPVRVRIAAAIFAVLLLATPATWLAYNAKYFHDPLDFIRGPYSARAIEARTTPPGSYHYPGYHDPILATHYYLRSAELDTGWKFAGFVFGWLALAGTIALVIKRRDLSTALLLLLWVPLPFYGYSVSYGSVPIFFPQWFPHSYYNTRYGLELLPAFAIFPALVGEWFARTRVALAAAWCFVIANAIALTNARPLVLQEALANSATRIPFESQLAAALRQIPPGASVLMQTSTYAGALQQSGLVLRQTINEGDYYFWAPALAAPASRADFVVAVDGDAVSQAVTAHPARLQPIAVITSQGQPRAVVYRSAILAAR
jgi:hypothetical protein